MSNYFTFWHINAPVFIRPVEVNHMFQSANIQALTAAMREFAETHQQLAVLLGPAGSGKTTLLRWLSQSLPMKTHDVFITTLLGREHDSGWLLPRIAEFFQKGSKDRKNLKETISNGINQLTQEARQLLICIDTAHLICTDEALSDLEAFFNLQDLSGIRISFVLSGNQELIERLKKHPSISLRVNSCLTTSNLNCDELESYAIHRLKTAGVAAVFDPEAIVSIYNESGGNFLLCNNIFEKCLIEAANKSTRRVTTFIVEKVLSSSFFNHKTVEKPLSSEITKDKDKPTSVSQVQESKATEHFERIPATDQQKVSKIDHERNGSIKLSSLFKHDKD
jgi:type II secretory pathway predicted ATPase ExeA